MLRKLSKNKRIVNSVAVLFLTILILLLIFAFNKKEPVIENVPVATATPKPAPVETVTPEPVITPTLVDMPVDFAAWQAYNSDMYAWIYIPNTSVNYPIFQSSTDDDYYLNRNVDGTSGYPGSIHSEKINNKDFTDHHTVLYGHNMRAGYSYKGLDATMFRTLHKFENATFFNENRYFYIYTPTQVLTYEIFAAYTYNNSHLLKSFDWQSDEGFAQYINLIYSQKGNIRTDTTKVTPADSIVTMETCTGNPDTRFLVTGVLRKREDSTYVELPDDNPLKKNMLLSSYL